MEKREKLVKVCRSSGMPVKFEHLDLYKDTYRSCYDRMLEKLELTETSALSQEQAARMERVMARVEKTLLNKYPNVDYWPFVKSRREWKAKVKQHGPIFVAMDSDTQDISYVILDTPLN